MWDICMYVDVYVFFFFRFNFLLTHSRAHSLFPSFHPFIHPIEELCRSEWGLGTSSVGIMWELARNAESGAQHRPAPSESAFPQELQVTHKPARKALPSRDTFS